MHATPLHLPQPILLTGYLGGRKGLTSWSLQLAVSG